MDQTNHPEATPERTPLDAAVIERMKMAREAMLQKFNEHTSGLHPLPPEKSLELRSHIQFISRTIEPGKHEMWPDYSATEKDYMAAQAKKLHEGAINLELAALGPWGGLAGFAKSQGAPLETVENLMQHGVDMMAVAGLAHAKSRNGGAVEPMHEIMKQGEVPLAVEPPMPKTNPRAMMQDIQQDVAEMQPILDWFKSGVNHPVGKFDEGRLAVLLEHYGGENAKIITELHSRESIDQHTANYRQEGMRLQAIEDAHAATHDFINAITKNGQIEPAKLKQTIQNIRDGDFMSAREYGALEYMRERYHEEYVSRAAREVQGMARNAGESDQKILDALGSNARLNAIRSSPYISSEPDQTQHRDQGPER